MNTKPPELIEKFIQLRALGWTFARIAEALNVSKPTLIQWQRVHRHRINNLRAMEVEKLIDQSGLAQHHFLQQIAEDLRRVRAELARRPLTDLPTHRLYALASSLRAEASRFNAPPHITFEPQSLAEDPIAHSLQLLQHALHGAPPNSPPQPDPPPASQSQT